MPTKLAYLDNIEERTFVVSKYIVRKSKPNLSTEAKMMARDMIGINCMRFTVALKIHLLLILFIMQNLHVYLISVNIHLTTKSVHFLFSLLKHLPNLKQRMLPTMDQTSWVNSRWIKINGQLNAT